MTPPRAIRTLVQPQAVFLEIIAAGKGFWTLFAFLAIEYVLIFPVGLATALARIPTNPAIGLSSLWSLFVHYAMSRAILVFAAGAILYYALRAKGPRKIDIWTAASLMAYAYLPHLIVMVVSVAIAHLSGFHPVLPHFGYERLSMNHQIFKGLMEWAPSAFLALLAARTAFTVSPDPEQSTSHSPNPTRERLAWAVTAILGVAVAGSSVLVVRDVAGHWNQYRPVLAGDSSPEFELQSLGGTGLASADLRGEVILIDFWATWCPPCVASMPYLEKMHREMGSQGFRLVSVNVGPEDENTVRAFMKERELTFSVYPDELSRMQRKFRVQTYPTAFLIDREGVVRRVHIGAVSLMTLRGDVKDLLEE